MYVPGNDAPTARTAASVLARSAPGARLIHCSENSGPAISSPSRAWPMCAPTCVRPGIRTSFCCNRVTTRFISGSEVPGLVSKCIRKSCSLNDGNRSWPRFGSTSAPAMIATSTVAPAHRGRRSTGASSAAYARLATRISGGSVVPSRALGSRMSASAGVTVRATTIEARTASP